MEELGDITGEILRGMITSVQGVIEFGKEEIPLLVQEILIYNTIKASVIALAILLIGILLYKFAKKVIDKDEDWMPLFIIVILVDVFLAFVFINKLLTIFMIQFAPRLYLLEYLKGLMSSQGVC